MNAPPKPGNVAPIQVQLEGVVLTPSAWLVSEHPREVMVYGRSALSSILRGDTVHDTEEYLDSVCDRVGDHLTSAFGHTYTVNLVDPQTQYAVDTIMQPVLLRVHAETNLSVTKQ